MENLRKVLLINSISSGTTGVLLLLVPKYISDLFATELTWPFTATGAFLLLFAILVFYAFSRPIVAPSLIKFIIFLDSSWVVASVIVLITLAMSPLGKGVIAVVVVWVFFMAFFQTKFLKPYLT